MQELNWPAKIKFNSFLEVELQFCNKSSDEIPRKHISRAPWEKEIGLYKYENSYQKGGAKQIIQQEQMSIFNKCRRWEKFIGVPSALPNMRLWKFETES